MSHQSVNSRDFLVCRGNGNLALVGKGFFPTADIADTYFPDTMIAVRPSPTKIDRGYLEQIWQTRHVREQIESHARTTNGTYKVNQQILGGISIPVPPLDIQGKIAGILTRADAVRILRREAIGRLDELAQSIFSDIFGDLVSNSRGWKDQYSLDSIATVGSGITKGRKVPAGAPTRAVPYLAVANVQRNRLDLSAVKEIEATTSEIERYRLRAGDLLLTEGGDPDKLGRGTLWRDELSECIHQNHIFRVRIRDGAPVEPDFLSWFVASERCRRYFLRSAKQTTGIASINASQLKSLPLILPPVDLQQEFAARLRPVEALGASVAAHATQLDSLFASLQYRVFRGEL